MYGEELKIHLADAGKNIGDEITVICVNSNGRFYKDINKSISGGGIEPLKNTQYYYNPTNTTFYINGWFTDFSKLVNSGRIGYKNRDVYEYNYCKLDKDLTLKVVKTEKMINGKINKNENKNENNYMIERFEYFSDGIFEASRRSDEVKKIDEEIASKKKELASAKKEYKDWQDKQKKNLMWKGLYPVKYWTEKKNLIVAIQRAQLSLIDTIIEKESQKNKDNKK